MITLSDIDLYLADFDSIWFTNCDARYRCLKGGRATGKSYNFIGIEPVFKILSDRRRNVMFVRQNDKDNSQSTYALIKSMIYKLGIKHLFKFQVSPHMITRKDTGQVILFSGMNDVENITSTTAVSGYLTDIYFEEASQLKSYDDFIVVDGSVRIPNTESDLKAQITFLFNAWDVGHWLYDEFFSGRLEDNIDELEFNHYQYYYDPYFNIGADGDGLALHISSYKCNPFLNEAKIRGMESLKDKAYNRYLVEGLGCWGHKGDATYEYYSDRLIKTFNDVIKLNYAMFSVGIDIGMGNGEGKAVKNNSVRSAMTMELVGLTSDYNKLVCLDEYFYTKEGKEVVKTSLQVAEDMIKTLTIWYQVYYKNYGLILVYVESADPGGFIDVLRDTANRMGFGRNVRFITSTKNAIRTRVDFTDLLMAYEEYLICERCHNLIREIKFSKSGEDGRARQDGNDHSINANEYAWIPLLPRIKRYKDYKEH